MATWFGGIGGAVFAVGLIALLLAGAGWLTIGKRKQDAPLAGAATLTGWAFILLVIGIAMYGAAQLG